MNKQIEPPPKFGMPPMEKYHISPKYLNTDFPTPLSIEDKITIFEDRVLGWRINIVEQMLGGKQGSNGKLEIDPIPDSSFAALDIIFSYFEMIARFEEGKNKRKGSSYFFKQGFKLVYPTSDEKKYPKGPPWVVELNEKLIETMWDKVRNGLYHYGFLKGNIVLNGSLGGTFYHNPTRELLYINPHLMIKNIKAHFIRYIVKLRNPKHTHARNNFKRRFDYLNSGDNIS